ncbi:NDR1/HIN1-like protein 13 [Magnolia sinica]|uniref:NDR1/HIN1-like protein 13 n=1 Tax=Magnolia sinica TaxID=86752 RepID=UPI00265809C3|nr:NDR1/HIN1-like protein 13 [Magnolia sinica]
MAEWVPPPSEKPNPPPDHPLPIEKPKPLPDNQPSLSSGTYVVQVPKEQIYRVPTPENAKLAEKYRNPPPRKSPCFSCFTRLGCFLIILVVLLATLVALVYFITRPKSPTFVIKQVQVRDPHPTSPHHPTHEYHIKLISKNPNTQMSISYQKGGTAFLYYKDKQIAKGKPRPSQQSHRSTTFQLALSGSDAKLPREIQKSFKGKGSKAGVPLSLSIDVPVRLYLGSMKLWVMRVAVGCDLTASTLAKGTRVVSHKCHAKIKT